MTVGHSFFEQTYQQTYQPDLGSTGRVPWDIGEPQPAVVALEEAGAFKGEVLDVGCGLGENAIFLAARGHRVIGVDAAPSAVRLATERASAEGVDVHFAVANATELVGYEDRFDTILDSGLYHCLNAEERRAYIPALARVGRSGARLHLLSFSDQLPESLPTQVTEQNLRENIVAPWIIENLSRTRYKTSMTREELRGSVSTMSNDEFSVGPDVFADLETDDVGRAYFTAWHLVARLP